MNEVLIYTDGSTMQNPGPGAYGFIAVENDEIVYKYGEFVDMMTNNQAELMATISSIEWFVDKYDSNTNLTIRTDSRYCQMGYNKWMHHWSKNGWKRKDGESVVNIDLWVKLLNYSYEHPNVKFEWIKGHNGNKHNEMVDEMCKKIWK